MINQFWQRLTLQQMTSAQWELLCDGCGYCCLHTLEEEDSGEIARTRVSCYLLDIDSCQCTDYQKRFQRVPMCVQLSPQTLPEMVRKNWLPATCSYRLLYEGGTLPSWHPLLSGDAEAVHHAGASVKYFALSEQYIHPEQLLDCIIEKSK